MLNTNQTLAHKLVTKTFWIYFFTIFSAPIGYLSRIIISTTLSVSEVGILYSVISFISLLSAYHDF